MDTLKLQSNGPLYNNTVTGTLAVDGWCQVRNADHRIAAICDTDQRPVLLT